MKTKIQTCLSLTTSLSPLSKLTSPFFSTVSATIRSWASCFSRDVSHQVVRGSFGRMKAASTAVAHVRNRRSLDFGWTRRGWTRRGRKSPVILRLTGHEGYNGPENNIQPLPPVQTSHTAELTKDRSSKETLECRAQDVGAVENSHPCTDLLPLVKRRYQVERSRPTRGCYYPQEESLEDQPLEVVDGHQAQRDSCT